MDPITATLPVLATIGDAFLAAVAEHASGTLLEHLRRDPAKVAVRKAIAAALRRYATGSRLAYTQPLLSKDSILTLPLVAAEMAHLVRFDQPPDVAMVARLWRDSLDEAPPAWINFEAETGTVLRYIEEELRDDPVFASVFAQKRLDAVTDAVVSASEQATASNMQALTDICIRLDALGQFLTNDFVALLRSVAAAPEAVGTATRDFSLYLADKTDGFIGRRFLFDEIRAFMDGHDRGYYLLTGDPGIGKSAVLAQLVKELGCAHYFNIRAEGVNQTGDLLRSTCAQLIARYALPHTVLPIQAGQDSQFLSGVLNEISSKLRPGERCVIVVDALDEADAPKPSSGGNTLFLPQRLPKGVFVVASMRRPADVALDIRMPERTLRFLKQDEENNTADIRAYIESQLSSPGIRRFIARVGVTDANFTRELEERSQGNFIYLRMVLPEIAAGTYADLALGDVPRGLIGYYEDHWRRIRDNGSASWFDYTLPVVLALTVVKEPVSLDLLLDFAGVKDARRVREALQNFDQFIYKTDVQAETGRQRLYRWYHASFFDFVASKEEIAAERVDLKAANGRIADVLWRDLYGDDGDDDEPVPTSRR